MEIVGLAKKVTIYISEGDTWQHKPLHSAILNFLKTEGCAGATLTRALAGFGAHSRIHTARLVDLSADLPLIITWVDNPQRVERLMPTLRGMVVEGLITVEEVEVVTYTQRRLRQVPANAPVEDIMRREVQAVQADTPAIEALEILLERSYRALPVVNSQNEVIGVLTDGDLLAKTDLLPISAQRALTAAELADALLHLRHTGQLVVDFMTPKPITVNPQTTIAQAVRLMVENDIKRLPVVGEANKLLGVVSRLDVLRAMAQPPVEAVPRQHPSASLQSHQIGDLMTEEVPAIQADASLAEIAGLLVANAQRRIVVVDEARKVVGIITDGDLIAQATGVERPGIIASLSRQIMPGKALPGDKADHLQLKNRTAAAIMTANPVTVTTETTLEEGLGLLLKHHIKRLPVVDGEGRLVGSIGRSDILRALSQTL